VFFSLGVDRNDRNYRNDGRGISLVVGVGWLVFKKNWWVISEK
jgi:hypothetical protein